MGQTNRLVICMVCIVTSW